MAYRYDKDLEFLKELSSPELDELVKILTHDKDGKVRFTEELTNNDLYKKHYPDHKEYIELILEEFQKFGGNSILNMFRGGGVLYNEILRDVAKKFDVKFDENESTNSIETSLLCKLIEEELKNSQDENTLRELVNIFELGISNINKQTVVMGLQSLIKIGGFKSYQIAVIVANQVMKFY